MYIGNQKNNEDIQSLVLQAIKELGIKNRCKKNGTSKVNNVRRVSSDNKVFKKPLSSLKTEYVTLKSGPVVEIPAFVVEACCHIKQRCDVEGIFRKAGSAARLREIKNCIDSGKKLEDQHHVIDVSNILTLFFRELPEPLVPFSFHDLLLRCLIVKENAIDGILLTCLLFPSIHLNTLAYLLEFFKDVAAHEEVNRMGISNLAIIITPSLMPVEEKTAFTSGTRLNHHVRVIKCLLENTGRIGFLPDHLVDRALASGCLAAANEDAEHDENDASKTKKKKKRRSGSLTRMINGLKKIVGKGSPDVSAQLITSTPDFSSPCVKSAKKRKLHESSGAFSSKKKKEILQSLPQSCALANAPCTPLPAAIGELHYTPRINPHPNPSDKSKSPHQKHKPRRFFSPKRHTEKNESLPGVKSESRLKSRLNVSRKSGKKAKRTETVTNQKLEDVSCSSDKPKRSSLEIQWKASSWRRKKCLSSSDTPTCVAEMSEVTFLSDGASCSASVFDRAVDLSDGPSSADTSYYVRIPKSEYEEIKNRVSAIESRISQEFSCIASDPDVIQDILLIDGSDTEICSADKVHDAYQKALEESEKLDSDASSTDHLAKRLSRELKIRNSIENKVIRSPSARKIGTIRRRSRESAKSSKTSLNRIGAGQTVQAGGQDQHIFPRGTLRRGRPNTLYTGLPQRSPLRAHMLETSGVLLSPYDRCVSDSSGEAQVTGFCESLDSIPSSTSQECVASAIRISTEMTPKQCEMQRAVSFHTADVILPRSGKNTPVGMKKAVSQMNMVHVNTNSENEAVVFATPKNTDWQSAKHFFEKREPMDIPITGRESVAKIRSQNAGMVRTRMRIFDPDSTPKRPDGLKLGDDGKPGQSLRIQCMQDNFLEKLHAQNATSASKAKRASPKKLGSPRKKCQSHRSPKNTNNRKQRARSSKSPLITGKHLVRPVNECNLKKFNSLRVTSHRSPLVSKVNVTAPPGTLNCEKENTPTFVNNSEEREEIALERKQNFLQPIHLPDNLKETIYDVCTPRAERLHKMSMSPLRDSNRIEVISSVEANGPNSTYKTPRSTPYIKKPLLVKSPSDFVRTPCVTPCHSSRRLATPLRALRNVTPLSSARR